MVHRRMRLYYHLLHVLLRPSLSSIFKFQVFGAENVPSSGGVLLMTNHASYVDPIFIGAAVDRNLYYMARSTLFKPGLVEWILLKLNAFSVHQGTPDRKAIRRSLQILTDGELLNIFPEGTRSRDGVTLGKALPGIGYIAHKTAAPVVPVYLSGTQNVLPRRASMLKPAKVTLSFGKPLDMERYRKHKSSREIYDEIGEEIMAKIAELRDELYRTMR